MTIINARDFRENQSKYLTLAAEGEIVILKSRKGQFKITPVSEDDSIISKAKFLEKIKASRKSIANGEGVLVSGKDELNTLLLSL